MKKAPLPEKEPNVVDLPPPDGLEASFLRVGEHEFAVLSFPVLSLRIPEVLSCAEAEIVTLLAEGLTAQEIANRRGRSRHTIQNQIKAIHAKLHVSTRAELIRKLAEGAA